MPKLSIVVPVHNEEEHIRRCLDSILSQSMRDLEIVCVDDGSEDNSAKILQDYVDREPRVHATAFRRNNGTVLARKLALMDVKGDYVMFVDADDTLLPGACQKACQLIEETKADILQFSVRIDSDEDLSMFRRLFRSREFESCGRHILYDCFVNHRFTHNLWNKIYKAEVCHAAVEAMPDIQMHHYTDQYLSFFLFFFANTFRSVPDGPFYNYSYGGGVSTKKPDARLFEELCLVSKTFPLIEKFLRDRGAYDTNVFVLDAMRNSLYRDIVNKLLTIPNLSREIIALAVKYWGSDVIFDFLSDAGMFKYPCENRLNLVAELFDIMKDQRKEILRLKDELDVSQGHLRKTSPRATQQLKNPARATQQLKNPAHATAAIPVAVKKQETDEPTPYHVQSLRFVQKFPKV